MDQSGSEWLEWRRHGVGGSESAVLMGANPWKTVEQLAEEKQGTKSEPYENERMARGKRLEPIVREMYQDLTGIQVTPVCVEHNDYSWFRASLDGINAEGTIIVEIKCPNDRAHSEAIRGWVPKYYYPQLQHQLGVTGASVCHYVSYSDSPKFAPHEQVVIVPIPPNVGYIKELILKEADFVSKHIKT